MSKNPILAGNSIIGFAKSLHESPSIGIPKTFRAQQLASVLESRSNSPVIVVIDDKRYNITSVTGGRSDGEIIALEVSDIS